VTVPPLLVTIVSAAGGPGAPVQPTTSVASFDGGLVPMLFDARTRT
jgi:hypothetical protein